MSAIYTAVHGGESSETQPIFSSNLVHESRKQECLSPNRLYLSTPNATSNSCHTSLDEGSVHAMRKTLNSDDGDSGSKKYKRGAYVRVRRSLLFAGVWSHEFGLAMGSVTQNWIHSP
jgi:hypothetical protein